MESPFADCNSWEEFFEIIFKDAFTIPFTIPDREAIALQFDSLDDMKEFIGKAETAVEIIAKPERFAISMGGCKGIFLIVEDVGMHGGIAKPKYTTHITRHDKPLCFVSFAFSIRG